MGDVIEQRRRYYSGLDADKASIPADGKSIGDQYFATDTKIRYFWDVANWIALGVDTINAGMIQTDAVETLKIKNLNVTEGKLGPLACAEAKIGNLAISAGKLKTDSVETLKIKALNVTPGKAALGFGRYVPRLIGAHDKLIGDFTTDGTAKVNGLDLSGIVPAGATGVVLAGFVQDDAADSWFYIYHSAGATISALRLRTAVANIRVNGAATIPIDTDRLMDYQGANLVFTAISIAVLGWFI